MQEESFERQSLCLKLEKNIRDIQIIVDIILFSNKTSKSFSDGSSSSLKSSYVLSGDSYLVPQSVDKSVVVAESSKLLCCGLSAIVL